MPLSLLLQRQWKPTSRAWRTIYWKRRAEVERAVNWRGTAEAAAINAIDRADRLREALDAVGALHEERKRDEGAGFYCPADGRTWPCPTAAIVQGATES